LCVEIPCSPLNLRCRKKPDRFYREKLEFQLKQEEKQKEIAQALKEKEDRTKAKANYYKQRERTKKSMTSKTLRGQPKLSKQVELLLGKLKKE